MAFSESRIKMHDDVIIRHT